MTKSECAQSRAICEAATNERWYKKHNGSSFAFHAMIALPAALDYIEQLEREILVREQDSFEEHGEVHYWRDKAREAIARAEALERAIKGSLKGCECLCDMCKKERNLCEACVFEFDQSRFSDKPTPCQEGEE